MPHPLLASKGNESRGRDRRRSVPIHVYVGHNGDGKTLHAVWDTLPSLELGRPALSTVRLLDYVDRRPCEGWETSVAEWVQTDDLSWRPVFERIECQDAYHGLTDHMQAHPLYVRFLDWRQLLAWRWGDVLMDEVTGVADASDWAAVPSAVVNKFPQLRRDECALRITTLSYTNCNKRIRQAALAVTRTKGAMPASRKSAFGQGRIYRPRRLSAATTYDAKTLPMDDPSLGSWDKARVIVRSRLWVPDCLARLAYDTYSPVDSVGSVTDSGRCAYCAGTRRAQECVCPDYLHEKSDRKAAASAGGTLHAIGRAPVVIDQVDDVPDAAPARPRPRRSA